LLVQVAVVAKIVEAVEVQVGFVLEQDWQSPQAAITPLQLVAQVLVVQRPVLEG